MTSIVAPIAADESDEHLMDRVQADDTAAFGELYDRHASRAFRVAQSVCRDAGRAEDAVQEGFLSIWRSRSSYRSGQGSFKAWAMQVTRNRAIDSIRREKSRVALAELEADPVDSTAATVSDRVVARSEGDALREALLRLPDVQSEVITLAFFGQLSHSEIAARLSLPPGTVKGRIRLGLEKLRREMRVGA